MKPTRICNWPRRLDLALPPDLRGYAAPPRKPRPAHALHPAMREVAQARWLGRSAPQRRFEQVHGAHAAA